MILFVSGFNRSGTTVLLEATAAATGGEPFTVGDLIRYGSPGLAERLRALVEADEPVDRGVDARPVTAATPEEYGWLLVDQGLTTRLTSRFHPRGAPLLRRVADDIAARSGTAVLKNPSDTGREDLLLRCFPEAGVIVTRRRLAGICDSADRALARGAENTAYGMALTGHSPVVRVAVAFQRTRAGAALLRVLGRWNLRLRVLGMLRRTARLPVERVAFLDYDELVLDPVRAASWAGHLLDAERLAKEFRASHSFPARTVPPTSRLDRFLDRRWARVWEQGRRRQLARGIVPAPAGTAG
ncbi:sulfotransferase [Actinocorallia populi]|uniref:sulfotransferase n=1 Tax=Actinocorallia populi TaxID=2079200 RepID=UPI000D092AA6|nr:sulfotransferase [Actinocorallia populi]